MATSVQLSFADLEVAQEAGPAPVVAVAEAARPDRDSVSRSADRAALAALEAALRDARASADARPPLVVLASCLGQLGVSPTAPSSPASLVNGVAPAGSRRLATTPRDGAEERERRGRLPGRDR